MFCGTRGRGMDFDWLFDWDVGFGPPMTVTREQIDEAIDIFDSVLSES